MGVLMYSSFLMCAGVPGSGLRSSDGYEAETGVCRAGTLPLLSLPDAADEAAAVAVAVVVVVDMMPWFSLQVQV